MTDDPAAWADFAARLALGCGGGALGAVVREFQHSDRELSWALLPKIAAGLAAGSLAVALGHEVGLDTLFADWAVAMVAGFIGQAAMIDIARQWLKGRGVILPEQKP
jgi:hypothetical protein